MDGWKSMFFGGGGGGASAAPANPLAVKWLGMEPAGGGRERLAVAPEAARDVLGPLGEQRVNLVSVFGAARQGKSFLMNLLAGQQDLFRISNLREPCTQGVDLAARFLPLAEFSALHGGASVRPAGGGQMLVGFVDAEGQGDRDITYDSRLVSPVLLASKTVIFNWKDSLQADRMLNLLAVLARAAQGIELADGDNAKVFGHLHIIFRDWSFVDSTPEQVFKDLFAKEKGRGEEAAVRNLARANLVDAFESITIWLFPAPVANTASLSDKIRFDQLQRPFQDKLRELRACLARQLQAPMRFNQQPLTARLLTQVIPGLVDALNSDQVIMPESIYASMVRAEANAVKDECERAIAARCEAAAAQAPLATAGDFERILRRDVDALIAAASATLQATPQAVRRDMEAALKAFADKEVRIALHAHNERVVAQLASVVDDIFKALQRECAVIEQSLLPMRSETLSKKCAELLAKELRRLAAVPAGSAPSASRVEAETGRIKQHASLLFEKLGVVNDRAVQKLNGTVADRVRAAKGDLTTSAHALIDKRFALKRPVTITALLTEIEDLYLTLVRRIPEDAGVPSALITVDYQTDLEAHKVHLAEELNRRYLIEIRQILNEVGYAAREDLQREVGFRLDGKLPLPEEELKAAIDAATQHVKVTVSQQLQGWTVLKSDIAAKSVELDNLGDVLTDTYLRRNHDLEKTENEKQQSARYEALRENLSAAFVQDVQTTGFPTTDDKIDAVFLKHLQTLAAQFLSFASGSNAHTAKSLREALTRDCAVAVENQKHLNRLAVDKQNALTMAETERKMREQERLAARKKEEQMSELKSQVEKSLGEKDSESKRLRDELRAQGERSRKLEQQMQALLQQSAQSEKSTQAQAAQQRQEAQAREREAAALKRELEEMKRKAAEIETQKAALELHVQREAAAKAEAARMQREIDEMRRTNALMAAQKVELEYRALEEAARREEAVRAARAAADAAALSAKAAIEAAAHEVTPRRFSVKAEAAPKRSLANGGDSGQEDDDDVDMEDAPPARAAKAPLKKRRGPTTAKTTPDKSSKTSLEEARRAAREEVERRIQERAAALTASKKKH
ncbi:hypothetical protein PybrP1_007435 [[Pythium] brassicae (nom. inval.)]|nr:hypothetical protein PybrP1_007435 [[Pythium] brassicae (nom. inval.)]